ncbi:MAG TPA: molybdopterin-binding protein, partial [Kofleriaceae bacterium]
MGALPVHIAVLTIADDAATADHATAQAIAERAGTAGHVIVDEEIVRDNEAAIHDQLVRWISHDNVDVVIVAASVESESAAAALAPLVVQTLPGFTDLFRWLTFQEIGASAMLSAAEAAQCQGTFVFVLPAHEGAVRAAMDKLILPQLDVRTKPKNLVSQMPRLRDAAKKFVDTSKSQPVSAPVFAPPVIAPQPIPAPPVIS